ncbi:Cell division protein DedD [Ephemeroptericola cinctiostellae]|uniref:Cell division protein DedD n=1 Tax=Ephemeroptericola cinctiostellae TaxID=2268024 RepID=A0A345DC40_9BURK|nr:SPOR domain-containing protein [Ephemeroptericola cinctiostellae]AXF85928.1 Cell division protein DedD [Ephemeroptericola cinctiostellae]
MWFKNKKETDAPEVTPRAPSRRRSTDIRSELGIGGDAASNETLRSIRPAPRRATQADTSAVYNEEVQLNDLKVRARRRLIGALVLLATAFVILPWVFDDSRKLAAPNVNVNVPDKNLQFEVKNPRATDTVTPAVADVVKPADASLDKATEKNAALVTKPEVKSEVKAEAKAEVKPELKTEVPAGTTEGKSKYVVHIGIVSDAGELNALLKRLSAAGVKASRETVTVDGVSKTRVRLGPFNNQTDAQLAANKAKGAAKNPVVIPLTPAAKP